MSAADLERVKEAVYLLSHCDEVAFQALSVAVAAFADEYTASGPTGEER